MISLRSRLRRKLLTFFYVSPKARAYVRQIAAAIDEDSTNVSRELKRLEREGLLLSELEGRQLYYTLNRDYPYVKPVFQILKGSVGIVPSLKKALERIAGIESAWIYGSFARGDADSSSDIDLLIVGMPDQAQLAAATRRVERLLRREINYTVFTPQELKQRLAARDAFAGDVWRGKRIELIGYGDDPAPTGKSDSNQSIPRRRAQKGGGSAEKPGHRRRGSVSDRVSGHAQSVVGADVEPRPAAARATRPPRSHH
jgi:predicted nucleotidyltransferase